MICQRRSIRAALLGLALLASWPRVWADTDTPAARDLTSVAEAKQALSKPFRYPWYDASNDSLRRITPAQPKQQSTSWNWDLGWLFDSLQLGNVFNVLVWLTLAALVAYAIYYLIRLQREQYRLAAASTASTKPVQPRVQELAALPIALDPNLGDWLALAKRHYEAGEYDQAIVYLFSHALVTLDAQHYIHLTRGKTNRQYLRELVTRDEAVQVYTPLMETFEAVFFGQKPLPRETFDTLWQLAARLAPSNVGSTTP